MIERSGAGVRGRLDARPFGGRDWGCLKVCITVWVVMKMYY